MDSVEGNPRKVMLHLPKGFDPAQLCEIQEKYGVKIPAAEMGDAPLLQFPCHVLAKIANRLDARSFVCLALTCYNLYSFLHQPSSRNMVQVPLQLDDLNVSKNAEDEEDEDAEDQGPIPSCRSELKEGGRDYYDAEATKFLDSLLNWPFAVRVQWLRFDRIGLPLAREFLEKLAVKSIDTIKVFDAVDYDDVLHLIDAYDVKNVQLVEDELKYTDDETHALLRKPFKSMMIPHAPSNLLHDTTISWLEVNEPPVSLDDLPTIIQKFLTSNTVARWSFRDSRIEATDLLSCFAQHPLFHISYTGDLPQQRPLIAFSLNGQYARVYILRADGRVAAVHSSMHFEVMAPTEVPTIFAPL